MPKRILLADDSITIQKVVELTFSDGDYEVTAVNNGARAILKLGEMRPDIILSDIIMPEKNGYEVCEYVKSHPEYRNIPVVLLTGTFEPFDPDRAEKAGCDAVVTKPFESQSLIHKVEELIAQAASSLAATTAAVAAPEPIAPPPPPPAAPEPEPSPWMDEAPVEPELSPSPFTTSGGSFPTPPEAYTHSNDIFGAPPVPDATTEMAFDAPADVPFGGETRAFPRRSFDELAQTPPPPPPPPAPETSPWDEQDLGGETRAFGKMSFEDLQSMQQPLVPDEPSYADPFGAPPEPEQFSSDTRPTPGLSFDELAQMANTTPEPSLPPPPPEPAPEPEPMSAEPSPWDEQPEEAPLFGGGATQAFPQVSFADFQQPAPEPEPAPIADEPSPWDEQPAFGGETRAFEKMSFDDLQSMQQPLESSEPEPQPEPEPEPEPLPVEAAPWEAPEEPAWSLPEPEEPAWSLPEQEPEPMQSVAPEAMPEDLPFATEATGDPELEAPPAVAEPEKPAWGALHAAEAVAEPEEPIVPPPALAPETPSIPIRSSDLTEEQIDKIARRVVELMSEQVVRNIAWEVIPDLAEMVVKERIRQLESEA
jgi:CheY-like chemotaxis protein